MKQEKGSNAPMMVDQPKVRKKKFRAGRKVFALDGIPKQASFQTLVNL